MSAASEANASERSTGPTPPYWAYGTAALAVASLTFAVIETIRWKGKEDEYATHKGAPATMQGSSPTPVSCGRADPGQGAVGCSDIYDAGRLAWTLSLVGYGLGAVLAAGSIYLFVADADNKKVAHPEQQQSLACVPDLYLHGASCGWRF
jgi:hypothetical protein